MRWQGQTIDDADAAALPGLENRSGIVRSVTTPEFAGMTFHEVLSRTALNKVPAGSKMPFSWTINPYRGCSHACVYCFARGTHEYLDLDGGGDFDSQIVVKVNVAEVLQKELRRGSWKHESVALGTNTDPYQRAEGRYKLMPDIIRTLADSGTPFSILTKGTLIRRDISLLKDAVKQVPIDIQMSIAMYDDDLQRSIEPGTPSTQARLDTVRALTDAGFRVGVFLMPIMPHLTDSLAAIDDALRRIQTAGADHVIYGSLHLRTGVKPWFMQWLEREHPELMSSYRTLYPATAANAPKEYRKWLAQRVRPLIRAYGLEARPSYGEHPARKMPAQAVERRAGTKAASAETSSASSAASAMLF